MADQLFFGSLYGSPLGAGSNSVIRFTGNVTNNVVTQTLADSAYLDISHVTVGMVMTIGSNTRTVTAVGASNFTVDGATLNAAGTVRVAPAAGGYYVSASVFSDPNNVLTVNDITGSNNTNFLPSSSQYAVHGKADGKTGIFHQYLITNVTQRDSGSQTISFFMEWNESGSEADTGDSLTSNAQYMAVHELSHEYKIAPNLSRRVGDLTNLEAGADQAGYNISLDNFDDINTGSFTGSFHGELTGSMTGSFFGVGSGSFSGSYEGSVRSIDLIATGSFTGSGHITTSDTASHAVDFYVSKSLTVKGDANIAGTLIAGTIHTQYETSSILYSSGSTKFGDTNDDIHEITGSLSLSGSNVDFRDSTGASGSFSGSFEGDGSGVTGVISASYATSASLSDTGSHALVANTASHATFAETAKTALTASAISFSELNQDLDLNGDLTVSGSGNNASAAIEIVNGILVLSNIPTFANDAAAGAGGVPIGGIYLPTGGSNFLIIRQS